jgi:hypothetical protein
MSEQTTEYKAPDTKEETPVQEVKPKRFIEVIGRKEGKDACEYCQAADKELSQKKAIAEGKVKYNFYDIETDKGEEALQEAGLSRRKGVHMPVIKDCTDKGTGEKPACKVYEGYEFSDFADLDNWDP